MSPPRFFPFALRLAPIFLLWTAGPLRAEEVREFKDAKGRTLKGELLKMRGPTVLLRTENGRETPVPFKLFSREDQTRILHWVATRPQALEYNFKVGEEDKILESSTENAPRNAWAPPCGIT